VAPGWRRASAPAVSTISTVRRMRGECRFTCWIPTGRDRLLGKLGKPFLGVTVSPDGKAILCTKRESQVTELMMIENFR
jgi:hypothetical protein